MTSLLAQVSGRIFYYIGVLTQDQNERALKDYNTFLTIRSAIEPRLGKLKEKAILDVGCGRRYPHALLLNSLGNMVVGIDTDYIGCEDSSVERYSNELTQNGAVAFIRALLFDLLKQKEAYNRALQQLCDFALSYQGIVFKRMSAVDMAFSDEAFDLVVSILVFEHIADVSKALSEINRVLKRGGFAFIKVHLFTSKGGGHQLGKEFFGVPPWDHLRQNKFPAPVYLNRLRKDEWLRLFSEQLEVLEVLSETDRKAEGSLTAEILSELSDYTKDELVTSTITVVAKKRSAQ